MESDSKSSVSKRNPPDSSADVLQCWKDIAVYFQRDLRTVMRWEHTRGMPVHRLPGGPKSAVYALKSELEEWRKARPAVGPVAVGEEEDNPESTLETAFTQQHIRKYLSPKLLVIAGVAVAAVAMVLIIVAALRRNHPVAHQIESLAVLPFENLNNDPGQDYIARGVHEALITDLAATSGIRVISHTSVMRYHGSRVSASQIARELNVDALVEGSVLRIGNRVRITAQLIRADTDEHLWAQSYDRELENVLGLMAEVSNAITGQVQAAVLVGRDRNRDIRHGGAVPVEAVDAYLRAQYDFQTLTPDGLQSALDLYRRSVGKAPDFAQGWRGIAASLTAQAFFGHRAASEVLPEAREAAKRALAIDDRLGEAYGILGYIELYWDWDFERAGKTLARAIELSPNSNMVRHEYADYLLITGDTENSLKQVRLGELYNPRLPNVKGVRLYHALMARHYEEFIAGARELIQSGPSRPVLHDWLGRALWLSGRREEALAEWKLSMQGDERGYREVERAYKSGGARAALVAMGERTASMANRSQVEAITVASWFAAAGDADRAMEWLKVSFSRKEPLLLHVVADPFFDPIRSNPRFESLLQEIGVHRKESAVTGQKVTTVECRFLPLSEAFPV